MDNSKLIVADLDFDNIKQNLKNFLKDQDVFSGYDFESTNLGTLINLLSYNTYYNNYYLNMMLNESFLDTSQLRSTTVSRAKMLGYTPKSVTSAMAQIQFTAFSNTGQTSIEIPKYTKFSTSIDGVSYSFSTDKTYTLFRNSLGQYIGTLDLIQGIPITYNFIVNKNDPNQKFLLSSSNIDTTTLKVSVKPNSTSTTETFYEPVNNFVTVNENSLVYYLEEISNGKYRIYFGSGNLGKELVDNNYITVIGFSSNGSAVNGATTFILNDNINGVTSYSISTIQSASGGSPREDIESIKFNATKKYLSQNRAVTKEDFLVILRQNLPEVTSIDVWGGEENDPPIYGKVFISLQPRNALLISDSLSTKTQNILFSSKLVSVIPEIVQPDYLYISFQIDAKYDSRKTSLTAGDISSLIVNNIANYFENNLKRFYSPFRFSVLNRNLQNIDISINSLNNKITMRKNIVPNSGQLNSFTVKFSNRISNPFLGYLDSVYSSNFSYIDSTGVLQTNCRIDDYDGILRVIRFSGADRVVVTNNIGTVDYGTGLIDIIEFTPYLTDGTNISIYAKPYSGDIIVNRGQIINLDIEDINVNVIDEIDVNSSVIGGTADTVNIEGGYLS